MLSKVLGPRLEPLSQNAFSSKVLKSAVFALTRVGKGRGRHAARGLFVIHP